MGETKKQYLTSEKIEELYGEIKLKFHSYYKYQFTFKGEAPDGAVITVSYGSDQYDIYRYTVKRDSEYQLGRPSGWTFCNVEKDGETIYEHFNY